MMLLGVMATLGVLLLFAVMLTLSQIAQSLEHLARSLGEIERRYQPAEEWEKWVKRG